MRIDLRRWNGKGKGIGRKVMGMMVELYTTKDGLDIYKLGYELYAWEEDLKEEGDIKIRVSKEDVEEFMMKGNYRIVSGSTVEIVE